MNKLIKNTGRIALCGFCLTAWLVSLYFSSPPSSPPSVVIEAPTPPQTTKPAPLMINKVKENKRVRMLYFGATWCGPCQQMKRLFKDVDVKKELAKLDFVMYDVDIDKEMARKHRIEFVPTMIFLKEKDGSVINLGRHIGGKTKQELLKILRNL